MQVTNFTYVVQSVDEDSKTMVLVYSTDGAPDFTVSALFPRVDLGETMEEIAWKFAPWYEWREIDAQYEAPEVGHSGTVQIAPQE